MTSSTSAAADRKLSEELTEITKVLLESNDHSLLPVIYKLSTGNSLISRAKKLEAQQTDDTLSRNNDGIPDIIAHGIMEEVRMQTTQVSTPEEPNYSRDPYYDAECKISEIIAKHRATTGTLSELRTQIEALIDKALADYIAGINKTMHVPGYSATVEIIKGIKGEALKLIDSAEARKR